MAGEYQSAMNLAGLGLSLASAIPTKQDKMQRRIAMGGEDPAVAALRQRLAQQNMQTAMALQASQQGMNPALAARNAQQALSQTQVQTNAELARGGLQSAQQARATDAVGKRRDLGLQMGANFLNTAGTMLATQEAAAGLAPPQATPAVAPATQALSAGLNGGTPMPVGPDGQPLFDPNAPSAANGVPSAQLNPGGQGGSGVTALPTPQATQAPVVPPVTGLQLPQANQAAPASQILQEAAAPSAVAPAGAMTPGAPPQASGTVGPAQGAAPPPTDPRTWATPQERTVQPRAALPPEVVSDPKNQIFLDMYDDAVMRGDQEAAQSLLRMLTTTGSVGMSGVQLPGISTPQGN